MTCKGVLTPFISLPFSSVSLASNQLALNLIKPGFKLEQLYEEEEDSEEDEDDFPSDDDESSAEPPPSREDLDGILDDFLDKYELLGGKMKQYLGGKDSTPAEKLALIRKELGGARIGGREWKVGEGDKYSRVEGIEDDDEGEESEDETPFPMPRMVGENREKWDVETVLCESSEVNLQSPIPIISKSY